MDTDTQNVAPQGSSSKIVYIIIAVVVLGGAGWFFTRGGLGVPAGVDIDKNIDGSATYSNEQGSVTVGGNSYPDNWPTDAPKYGNATVQYAGSSNPQTGKAGAVVVFVTSDKAQAVVDFYKRELAANGWAVEQTATMGQITVISGRKGETTFGVQIADGGNGQTTVTAGIGN